MDVEYRGRAAFLPAASALVVADLHVGRTAVSTVEAPVHAEDALVDRLAGHVDAVSPATVVVAGDVLHAHGSVPRDAREVLDALAATVDDAGADLVLVRGNHDTLLDHVDLPATITVADDHRLADGTVVCHGHEDPVADAPRYVVGHDHPAIRVEGARHPCFLHGEQVYDSSDVLVLPAFSRAARGTLVNGLGSGLSPLVADLADFRPVVAGRETYRFPPLGEFADAL